MPLDEQLMQRVFSSPQLPSIPAIALQIIALVQEDDVDVDKIASTISLDPALSTKLLKTVNSSFYGLPKTVGSVNQAVIALGLNSVKTLALGFSLVGNLTGAGGQGFDHAGFWKRSLYCATMSKALCEQLNVVQAEEVFMASLLQDVGVLALAQVLEGSYAKLTQSAAGDHRLLSGLEQSAFGGDHCEVGGQLAESWGLPPLLVKSIELHERPEDAADNLVMLVRTVSAGALAADLIENPEDPECAETYYRSLAEWFEIDRQGAEGLLRQACRNAEDTKRLLELPAGDLADAEMILEQASAARQALVQAEQSTPAETPANQPKHAVDADLETDNLTGLLSRRQFDERLDELFILADGEHPLSLIFIDMDQFERVNQTHGREHGDAALRLVGQTIQAGAKAVGQAFRFGEDDFALLCPAVGREAAALLAERLRSVIEQLACPVGEGEQTPAMRVTASIGVVTCEGTGFKRPEQMLKAASNGVNAAKDGGSNRVRVFVPRASTDNKAA